MATPVIMPRQGQSVESCIIGKWHKNVGDKVSIGDILFTYETDKSTFDEESKTDGMMLAMFFEEGDDVPCLMNVCVIGEEGEVTDEFKPDTQDDGSSNTSSVKNDDGNQQASNGSESVNVSDTIYAKDINEELKISPRAKNLADRLGVDIYSAPASGPGGRIIERDIKYMADNKKFATAAAKADYKGLAGKINGNGIGGRVTTADIAEAEKIERNGEGEFVEIPNTNIRKVIAKTMHQSLSTMAQLTLNASFDATDILNYRKKLKSEQDKPDFVNITLNDIILYAVSRVILNHKEVNAHYYDDKMVFFKNAHLGVATDTPRGLMVPTLFNANTLTLKELSRNVKDLTESTRAGTISPDMLKDGTFTITNLGTLDIESFTPVINPPQTCILGVNNITDKVKNTDGQTIVIYKSMGLSLTFDHRALDGAPAARFLKDLKIYLENFTNNVIKSCHSE